MYLLKLTPRAMNNCVLLNSHSTMYLLKLAITFTYSNRSPFTFHHVSIKTEYYINSFHFTRNSHSTMYLLKQIRASIILFVLEDSHSTMYLLKQFPRKCLRQSPTHSHSTMYLLKLVCFIRIVPFW